MPAHPPTSNEPSRKLLKTKKRKDCRTPLRTGLGLGRGLGLGKPASSLAGPSSSLRADLRKGNLLI
jgi:hypothetical protein